MTVRCKMKLTEIHKLDYGQTRFVFQTFYDSSIPEDQRFYKATPSGEIRLLVDNPKVIESYQVGKYYYFDSIPVPEPVPAN